jgi:short-subunit dehydrogenase
VEVLVNNAGVMYCQGIAETSERMLKLIMMVHMNTPLMLCRKYVGAMKERGCGYILNISSLAAWMSWPGIGMYGNTKAFVRNYSRELRIECQKTGVSVTNAYFGAVDTPLVPLKDSLRKLARALAVMITPEKAVERALKATFRRRRGVMPGVLNHIFRPICLILPDCLLGWIYRKVKHCLMKV